MIHIKIENNFICGIGPQLPAGDIYFYESESRRAGFRDEEVCPKCYPEGKPQIGTPLSELSGRSGHPGYERFKAIAQSWGYD